MTKLEILGVKKMYALHCEINRLTSMLTGATNAERSLIMDQIKVLEDELVDLHDALVERPRID